MARRHTIGDLYNRNAIETVNAATAASGAATLNGYVGTVTSESLTTAAGADYTLTITNSKLVGTEACFASVTNGTNTQGGPLYINTVTGTAGQLVIKVRNAHATQALNGTLVISFAAL